MSSRKPLQLDRMVLFAAVAEAGGFTAAAERLDTSKTLLSHQVRRLEAELGTALFTRTTRRVTLTEAGERLLRDCAPALRELTAAVERAAATRARPMGTLRITAPPEFASGMLGMALGAFARQHPELQVELVSSSEVLDLVRERLDLAIRVGWLRDSSFRATRLGDFEQFVVASPAYLARAGVPQRPEDLVRHRWIALTVLRAPLSWRFTAANGNQRSIRVQAIARANSPDGVLGLLRGGVGISVLTDIALEPDLRSGRLQRVLAQWSLPSGGIYVVYPSTRQVPAKVRAFIDFLRAFRYRSEGRFV
jgi:DNA-binding transcriptional LysR family regulator